MFQSYLSEYSILEVETFRMYFHMIELSAYERRRFGHMRVSLDWTSNLIFFSNFHFFSPAWVTRLGVPANVRNFKLLVRTVHTYTYHPCKNERLAMSSVAILSYQIWGNIGQILEFAGQIAIYKVVPCFNHISQSIQSWRLKLLECISI